MGEEGGGARRGAQLSAHLRSQAVDFCTTVQPLDLGLEELQSVGGNAADPVGVAVLDSATRKFSAPIESPYPHPAI